MFKCSFKIVAVLSIIFGLLLLICISQYSNGQLSLSIEQSSISVTNINISTKISLTGRTQVNSGVTKSRHRSDVTDVATVEKIKFCVALYQDRSRKGIQGHWYTPRVVKNRSHPANSLLDFWTIMNKSYIEDHTKPPQMGDYICEDAMCSEFLNQEDLRQLDSCVCKFQRLLSKWSRPTVIPKCHFINHTHSASKVALLSFPGSGNTWIRGLLEKTTGVCTGTLYKVYKTHEC